MKKPRKSPKVRLREIEEELEDLSSSSMFPGYAAEELSKKGIYYITGEIQADSLLSVHQDIVFKHVTGWQGDIQLIINSSGGEVGEVWALIDLLDFVPFIVRTLGIGECASAAAALLASGTTGYRCIGANATIMVHRFTWGSYDKHAELVEHRKAEEMEYDRSIKFWLERSKWKTKLELEKNLLRPVDTWLSPKEAVRHGIVDKVLASK